MGHYTATVEPYGKSLTPDNQGPKWSWLMKKIVYQKILWNCPFKEMEVFPSVFSPHQSFCSLWNKLSKVSQECPFKGSWNCGLLFVYVVYGLWHTGIRDTHKDGWYTPLLIGFKLTLMSAPPYSSLRTVKKFRQHSKISLMRNDQYDRLSNLLGTISTRIIYIHQKVPDKIIFISAPPPPCHIIKGAQSSA